MEDAKQLELLVDVLAFLLVLRLNWEMALHTFSFCLVSVGTFTAFDMMAQCASR